MQVTSNFSLIKKMLLLCKTCIKSVLCGKGLKLFSEDSYLLFQTDTLSHPEQLSVPKMLRYVVLKEKKTSCWYQHFLRLTRFFFFSESLVQQGLQPFSK